MNDFEKFMSAYDWREAMKYAEFSFDDVEEVIYQLEGENDEADWELVVLLKSGKYGWLRAGCDYSGWDCVADGDSGIVDTKEDALTLARGGKK